MSQLYFCFLLLVIGGYGNTRQIIRKTAGDELFEKVQLRDLITLDQPTRILIQMTNGISQNHFFIHI